jgi:hypothetical protein
MVWGQLNNALTAWRNAYNARLPGRGTASDGAIADDAHGSGSQHQPDSDTTVDANDMDVNVLGSSNSTGTDDELRIVEAMKLDFERDPHGRGHLWIHRREIAEHDEGWREEYYGGANAHDMHVHWESRQDREDDGREWPMPETDKVLRSMGLGDDMQLSDTFTLSDDACEALGKPLGTKINVETAYEYMIIHSARESRDHYTELNKRLTAIEAKLEPPV